MWSGFLRARIFRDLGKPGPDGSRDPYGTCGLALLALLAALVGRLGLGGETPGGAVEGVGQLRLDLRRAVAAVLRGLGLGVALLGEATLGGLRGVDLVLRLLGQNRALHLLELSRVGVVHREVGELELAQESHDGRGLGELPDLPHEEIDHLAQLVAAGRPTEPELGAGHEDLADVDLHRADAHEDRAVAALAELGGERRELREVVAGARGGGVEGLVDAREGGLGGDHESSEVFGGGGWEVA